MIKKQQNYKENNNLTDYFLLKLFLHYSSRLLIFLSYRFFRMKIITFLVTIHLINT